MTVKTLGRVHQSSRQPRLGPCSQAQDNRRRSLLWRQVLGRWSSLLCCDAVTNLTLDPASDLGLGWALVRSVLKNFSLGNMITRRLFPANNSFCLSIFLSRLFLLNVPAIFPNLILYHVQVSNRKRFIFYLFWQTSYFQVNCCGKQLQVPE